MAKYSGSWYKGFASTFSQAPSMVLNVLALKEKRKAQKKIDDAVEELKLNSTTLAAKFDAARADGTISQEDYGDMVAWALPLGNEIIGRVNTLTNNYKNLSQEQIDNELADINAFYELSADLDFQNIEEMEAFGSKLTQPNAKMKWDLILKSIKKRKEPVQPEVFTSPEAILAKYPDSGYTYSANAGGYVPTYQKPTKEEAPPTELDIMGETQKKLDAAYATGNANYFNQMAKSLNVPTTFETYKQKYEKPEAATGAEPKVQDPNDVLFGTNGIMKDYIGSGSQLGEEQKTEIRNNYELIKPSLTTNVRTQVEDYLGQIGIDVNVAIEEPEVLLDIKKKPFWQSDWKYYQNLSVEELYQLADKDNDKKAYDELKKRGLIK